MFKQLHLLLSLKYPTLFCKKLFLKNLLVVQKNRNNFLKITGTIAGKINACRTTYFCILVSMIGLHVASQFSGVHGPNKMQINELVFKFAPTEN